MLSVQTQLGRLLSCLWRKPDLPTHLANQLLTSHQVIQCYERRGSISTYATLPSLHRLALIYKGIQTWLSEGFQEVTPFWSPTIFSPSTPRILAWFRHSSNSSPVALSSVVASRRRSS
ncbi:hypothetical protein M405DRAFT_862613 [Rhizopogon salebrosus TDB-379]|nr:hypothetical protein M405DRAFT_862613 [Rhizopogon salebrosus TDB-379]